MNGTRIAKKIICFLCLLGLTAALPPVRAEPSEQIVYEVMVLFGDPSNEVRMLYLPYGTAITANMVHPPRGFSLVWFGDIMLRTDNVFVGFNHDAQTAMVPIPVTPNLYAVSVQYDDPGSSVQTLQLHYAAELTADRLTPPAGYRLRGFAPVSLLDHGDGFPAFDHELQTAIVHASVEAAPEPEYGWIEPPYINGLPDGSFRPQDRAGRAEAAQMLFHLLYEGEILPARSLAGFPDAVPPGHWAHEALSWALAEGYIEGTDTGYLLPEQPLSRAEVAAVLARYLDPAGAFNPATAPDPGFADIFGHWAEPAIRLLAEAGVVQGRDDGRFHPESAVTRAELVALLARTVGRSTRYTPGVTFRDVDETNWAFRYIMNAGNGVRE